MPTAAPLADTDQNLVYRAKQGDLAAFSTLVSRYEQVAFRTTLAITRNHEDAEDALQSAWLKAFTRLGQFQGTSQFHTWLISIAVNEALMQLRQRRRCPIAVSLDAPDGVWPEPGQYHDTPETRCANAERGRIVQDALATLPVIMRRVVEVRDLEQRSTAETAERLQLSTAAVKSRVFRARKVLARVITNPRQPRLAQRAR